jgi:hypothetical protein
MRIRHDTRTFTAVACVAGLAAPATAALAADRALVLNTDFASAYYSGVDLAPPFATAPNVQSTCADAAVRARGDRLYILGRFGCDFVQVVDPATLATLDQFSTGNGTNPQDIVVVTPTKAYVTLYERDEILIVNPQTGMHTGSIDVSMFSDADGLPEAAGMAMVGDRVFVALQRLDRPGGFVAANPSLLVVVNAITDQIVDVDAVAPGVQAIALTGRNPFTDLVVDPVRGKIVVGAAGNFGVLDGGLEFVDPATLDAEGFFVTEATLGGDLNAARLWVDCTGYAIVNDATFRTKLVRFDRCTGQVLSTPHQSLGFDLADVEIDYARDHVLVSDRDLVTPGVRVYAAATGTLVAGPLALGLPPGEIAFAGATLTDAPPVARAGSTIVNRPDPFNPSTTIALTAAAGTRVRVEIADVRGRIVRVLWEGVAGAGPQSVVWDGRDARGVSLPSGVYWARAVTATGAVVDRMTLVR